MAKKRVADHVSLNTPQSMTVLSSMRLNGVKVFVEYRGGTTGERFVAYLKDVLLPTLKPNDIVVMDNLRSHHVKTVEETILAAGMIPLARRWCEDNEIPYIMRKDDYNSKRQEG